MATTALLLFLIAFTSETLGTLSGFGSSAAFVPLASLVADFHLVLALTGILHVFGNCFKLILFRGAASWRPWIGRTMVFVLFTGLGAFCTSLVSVHAAKVALGIILLLTPFLMDKVKGNAHFSRATFILSGFFTGLVGTGGALRGAAFGTMGLNKDVFVFANSFVDLGGDIVRAIIYLSEGYMRWSDWPLAAVIVAASVLGTSIGKALLKRMEQRRFELIVKIVIVVSGCILLWEI